MDESWIHIHYAVSKCWQSSRDKGVRKNYSPGQRWIIVHAGSEYGIVPGVDLLFKIKSKKGDYNNEIMNGKKKLEIFKRKINTQPATIIHTSNGQRVVLFDAN